MVDTTENQRLVARMAAVPARIEAALAGWDETRMRMAPRDGGWSPAEILAHLRASDDILAPRVYMILARDEPPLAAFDERRWAEVAGYAHGDVRESLAIYAGRRAELVAALRAMPADAWARTGISEMHGRMTLEALVRTLVEHEEEHCAQLETLVL